MYVRAAMPDTRPVRKTIALLVAALGAVLMVWSAWLYHFAFVATDETTGFWIVIGTFSLVLGAVALVAGVRSLRRAPKRLP
jgi:hypothetical protein